MIDSLVHQRLAVDDDAQAGLVGERSRIEVVLDVEGVKLVGRHQEVSQHQQRVGLDAGEMAFSELVVQPLEQLPEVELIVQNELLILLVSALQH